MTEKVTAIELREAESGRPALSEMPERAREVLVLMVCGYTQDVVAKRLGVTQSAISQTIKQYDPDGIYKPDMDLRKEVVRSSIGTVLLEATRNLVEKVDDLKEYKAKTLLELISKLQAVDESLGAKEPTESSVAESLKTLQDA